MTTCPYCNSPLMAELSGHVICPRCGETVRAAAADGKPGPPIEPPKPVLAGRTNRQIGVMVLAIMLLMASIALVFALNTKAFRRANDRKAEENTSLSPTMPAERATELAGLGYIPDDVRALIGIDFSRLGANPAGKALLEHISILNDDAGIFVDHAAAGLTLDRLPPRFTVALRSPTKRSSSQLQSALDTSEHRQHGKRLLEKAKLGRTGLDIWLWRADDRTLVTTQLPSDFDAIPPAAQTDIERFRNLGDAPRRLDPRAGAWLVGQLNDANVLQQVLTLFPKHAATLKPWQQLGGIVVSAVPIGNHLEFAVQVRGSDPAATAAIADWCEQSLGAAGVVPKRSTDGDWQRLQATVDADAVAKWFRPRGD